MSRGGEWRSRVEVDGKGSREEVSCSLGRGCECSGRKGGGRDLFCLPSLPLLKVLGGGGGGWLVGGLCDWGWNVDGCGVGSQKRGNVVVGMGKHCVVITVVMMAVIVVLLLCCCCYCCCCVFVIVVVVAVVIVMMILL